MGTAKKTEAVLALLGTDMSNHQNNLSVVKLLRQARRKWVKFSSGANGEISLKLMELKPFIPAENLAQYFASYWSLRGFKTVTSDPFLSP